MSTFGKSSSKHNCWWFQLSLRCVTVKIGGPILTQHNKSQGLSRNGGFAPSCSNYDRDNEEFWGYPYFCRQRSQNEALRRHKHVKCGRKFMEITGVYQLGRSE